MGLSRNKVAVPEGAAGTAVSIGAAYRGLIEIIGIGNGDCILCNEEGKLIGLEGNRRVGSDIIAGVFYIMSEGEDGDLVSLSEEKIQHNTQRFWKPEVFDSAEIEPSVHIWFFCAAQQKKNVRCWTFFFSHSPWSPGIR